MGGIFAIVLGLVTLLPAPAAGVSAILPCTVTAVLESQSVPHGTYAITAFGSAEQIAEVLLPAKIDDGAYDIRVTRKGDQLYQVNTSSLYLLTRGCYQYSYGSQATLRVRSGRGELTFDGF